MNMDQDILEIIAAELNGENLADNERQTLANWLNKPNNKKIFKEYENIFLNKDDIASFEDIDANNAWENHLNRVNSTRCLNYKTLLKYTAIILPFVIALSIFFNLDKGDIFSNENYYSYVVPKGEVQEIVLEDGTKVWINSDSELKYPKKFRGNKREIYLKGEAYFSVTKNKQKPFIVNSDHMEIKVLGTEFNLCCYENSENIEATLYEGKVAYSTISKKGILKPGFQAVLNKESNIVKVRKVNVSQFTSWKEGIYIFDGIKIKDLAIKICRWYDLDVKIASDSVKNMEFTGALEKKKPVNFIMELLEETNSVKCKLIDGVLYINEIL